MNEKKRVRMLPGIVVLAVALTSVGVLCAAAEPEAFDFDAFWLEPSVREVPFDVVILDRGEEQDFAWQEFVYTGMRYGGQPVRVHAFSAVPNCAKPSAPRPGIVVTHGLFGKATLASIVPFAKAGYPCIMWEWEMHYNPTKVDVPDDGLVSLPHSYYPLALYPDRKYPRATPDDEWRRTIWYPAVIGGRRAITWLQQQPGVDPDRIGATGGSYGGLVASLLATVDPRIRAAVSYSFSPLAMEAMSGLLSLSELSVDQKREYARRFDSAENLARTKAAIYWVVGTHDRPFFPPTIQETFARTGPPRALYLIPNTDHIHPSEAPALAWFDSVLEAGSTFPDPELVEATVAADGVQVRIRPKADLPLTHVSVYWSDVVTDAAYTEALWRGEATAPDESGTWCATLRPPFGGDRKIRIFVNVRDSCGAIVSSTSYAVVSLDKYVPATGPGAQAMVAEEGTIRIARRDKGTILDGDPAEWPATSWTPWFVLEFVSGQSGPKPTPRTSTLGDMDARFAAVWNPDHLLFTFEVHSPFPLVNAAPAHDFWRGDSFQIRLFAGPGAEAGKAPGAGDVVLHVNGWRDSGGNSVLTLQSAQGGRRLAEVTELGDSGVWFREAANGDGWTAEGRIPWRLLGLSPATGTHLRMGLQVNISNESGDMSLGYCQYNNGQSFGEPAKWGAAVLAAIAPDTAVVPNPATTPVAVNPCQRRDVWMAKYEALKACAKQGGIGLLFLGDSITEGWGGEGKAVWDKYYGHCRAAFFGIGGDATQHLLWRIENGELDGIEPKVVALQIGTNNNWASGKPNTPEQIAAGVAAVVERLRSRLPDTKILLLGLFARGNADDLARQNNEATNAIIAGLGDNKHVFYRDINDVFVGPDAALNKNLYLPDLLHLNAAGYERWAKVIEVDIRKWLGDSGAE